MVSIQSDVPMPPRGFALYYPWESMNVGDSFLFPEHTRFPYETARSYSRRHKPKQFQVRRTDKGYRCWRVA